MTGNSVPDDAAEQMARAKAIIAERARQFAQAPPADIVGLVEPSGAGAGKFGNDPLWTLRFKLTPWRQADGAINPAPLNVAREMEDDAMRDLQNRIKPYLVARIRARVITDETGTLRAEMDEFLGEETGDGDLNQVAADLQKPVTFDDPTLGVLTLERAYDCFIGTATWCGDSVSVMLEAKEPAQVKQAARHARTLWDNQDEWSRRINDYAVQELLPLKNDTWLDDESDEKPLTPDQFKARMRVESIGITPDGGFDFIHDDGDLFFGHAIQITGTIEGGPDSADIPG